jgi:protein-disulfide isomerase
VLLGLAVIALGWAIVSLSVGNGGPKSAPIGGVNDVQEIFGGIQQDGAFIGPSDATTTITVFNDIQCGPCADYEINTIDPLVEKYARTGDARLEFRHFSLAPNDTTLGAIAAEAAGKQDRQWEYLDTLVRNIGSARANTIDDQFLHEVAEAVPELDVDEWQQDYDDPATKELVVQDAQLAEQLKLPAEPAVVVTGPDGERDLIESPDQTAIEDAVTQVSGSG